MSSLSINSPFFIFSDRDGKPLDNGYIWIGTANLDPQTNPINVYWDAALTIPASQPIRTSGGYPVRNGTPATIYAGSDYSIRVQDKKGSLVFNAQNEQVFLSSAYITFLQSGTGAVQRTVQSKLRDFVSIKDFGAVGDGATDNSAAIQAAIDATPAGGELHIPLGTFLHATGLTIGKAITITGVGCGGVGGSRLKYTGSGNAITFTGGGSSTGARFSNFVIEGTASANNGLYIYNAFNNILFKNVYITDFSKASANAVYMEDAWDVNFINCYFRSSYNGVNCGLGPLYAVVNACKFIACEFVEIENVGFSLKCGSGNLVTGCDFSGQVGQIKIDLANSLGPGTNHACNGNVIENCYLEGGTIYDDTAIRIGQNATIGTSLLKGNVISSVYMDWRGDYIHLYNCLATVIRDPRIGTVQATKKAIIVDSTATLTKIEWQQRSDITDNASNTQYITQDLITLTEAQGNYTSPNKSMFQARPSANINNVTGNGTVYTVIFGAEVFDTQNEFNTSTGIFTATKAGKYQFSVGVTLSGMAGATFAQIRLVTTARSYDLGTVGSGAVSSAVLNLSSAALADMQAGHTAKITVEVNGIGADSADILQNNTFFCGFLVG
jgi:hypothetical protein